MKVKYADDSCLNQWYHHIISDCLSYHIQCFDVLGGVLLTEGHYHCLFILWCISCEWFSLCQYCIRSVFCHVSAFWLVSPLCLLRLFFLNQFCFLVLSCHWSLVVWATHGIFSPPLLSTARYLSCIPFWCSSFWQLTCTGVTVGSGSVCLQWPSELETLIRVPHSLLHNCSEDSYWRLSSHVTTILNLQSNASERRFTIIWTIANGICGLPSICEMFS